jgi:hypothetical protein
MTIAGITQELSLTSLKGKPIDWSPASISTTLGRLATSKIVIPHQGSSDQRGLDDRQPCRALIDREEGARRDPGAARLRQCGPVASFGFVPAGVPFLECEPPPCLCMPWRFECPSSLGDMFGALVPGSDGVADAWVPVLFPS